MPAAWSISLYNIVDQIFVGHSIGELDNAATNVAFPLVMIVTTLAMVFGVGGAYRGRGVRGGVAAPGSEGNATVDCLTVLEKIPSLFARRNFFFLIFRKQFISIQTTKGEYDMPVSRKQGL